MLKLRKVEIVGFKSFCERTVVTFSGSGTTCIVGPNGCGKSNVVDAISWVLGEQSHKSLRAERMADCIFNGTQKRPPLGLAEVTITLEDPELAEAARFVLEGADQQAEADDALVGSGDSGSSTHTEFISLVPAPPEAVVAETPMDLMQSTRSLPTTMQRTPGPAGRPVQTSQKSHGPAGSGHQTR